MEPPNPQRTQMIAEPGMSSRVVICREPEIQRGVRHCVVFLRYDGTSTERASEKTENVGRCSGLEVADAVLMAAAEAGASWSCRRHRGPESP
jgi:hypothetical protein